MAEQRGSDNPVIAVDERSSREWLQAADIVITRHRNPWRAMRWAGTVRRRLPGCTVAVSRIGSGRWYTIGLPGHTILFTVHSRRQRAALDAADVGRLVLRGWLRNRPAGSGEDGA